MLINPYAFASVEALYRASITVPDASIASTLTDFPVYVDLSDMPAGFWAHFVNDDGGDIRLKLGDGTDIPFDLLWIDRANQRGALFYRRTLTNGGDTTVYIHYGASGDALVPVADSNGRNAVWTDYERVFTFGDNLNDRTGNGVDVAAVTSTAPPRTFENTTTSANLGVHQGVAWDGTHYYAIDTNTIKKYDASFNLVASNTDPCGDVIAATGDTVDHCADSCVHNGMLYVPIEIYLNISTWSNMKIARFDITTLDLIDVVDVSAQGHEVSSICFCPEDGLMYVTSFADGSQLFRYNPDTLAYEGALALSGVANVQFQGITWWRGAFWMTSDSPSMAVFRCEFSGVKRAPSYYISPARIMEGIESFGDEGLLILDEPGGANGVVRRLVPYRSYAGGGVALTAASGENYIAAGVTKFTDWSVGVSLRFSSLGANRALVSYEVNGSVVDTNRATLAFRTAVTQLGLWNATDSWLMTASTTLTATDYRLNATHQNTTARNIYLNGGGIQTDSGVAQKPSGTANALYIGVDNLSTPELMDGLLGFIYLREGVLSADWIAAEFLNINNPTGFYTVGSEEVL